MTIVKRETLANLKGKRMRRRRGTEKGSKAEALAVLSLRNSRRTPPLRSPSLSLSVSQDIPREIVQATDNSNGLYRPTTELGCDRKDYFIYLFSYKNHLFIFTFIPHRLHFNII
jgi:hypothetical protein